MVRPFVHRWKRWAVLLTAVMGMGVGFSTVAHAQAVGCPMVDRTLKGQQAWRMVLRYGTPEQLSTLVVQSCVDPNVGQDMGLSSALSLVANRTMLNQAIALGWRPLDELAHDESNQGYINPLIRRMIALPKDRPAPDVVAWDQMLAQRYHLNIDLHDHRTDSDEEDVLVAIADLLPSSELSAISPTIGVNVLSVATAGKHDRLVQEMMGRQIPWTQTYLPGQNSNPRGPWDLVMDPNTCVQRARANMPEANLSGKALEQKQISMLRSLQQGGANLLGLTTASNVVPGLSLNIATQAALWFSPETWGVMRQTLPNDQAYVSEGTASDIREFQKKWNRPLTYSALLGPALPDNVCSVVTLPQ